MDAPLIGELLDPEQTYAEVSLPIFTQKLEEIFKDLRKFGDTSLEVETGNCCGLSCCPELIRTAYRFVGNHTRHYIDFRFIIELTEDGKDHRIKDIFECFSFKGRETKDWYGTQVMLTIYNDEESGFYLSPDEVIHTEIALKADAEIFDFKNSIPLDEVEYWILKYRPTFLFIHENNVQQPDRFLRWNSFFHTYLDMEQYLSFFQKWEKTLAVEACKLDYEIHEDFLIDVIQEAERILVEEEKDYLLQELMAEEPYKLMYCSKPFVGEAADNFSASWHWLKPRQEAMVKKYYALTETETDSYLEEFSYSVGELRLLTFHLDIREKAKKRKGYIPFGLGEKTFDELRKVEDNWGKYLD